MLQPDKLAKKLLLGEYLEDRIKETLSDILSTYIYQNMDESIILSIKRGVVESLNRVLSEYDINNPHIDINFDESTLNLSIFIDLNTTLLNYDKFECIISF